MHPGNTEDFFDIYREELEASMVSDPDNYPVIGFGSIPEAAQRIANKFKQSIVDRGEQAIGGINISSSTWKRTCKRVGIKHTYTAIKAYLA